MSEKVKKVKLSWKCIEDKVNLIASKLNKCKFDAVISIGRGGMVPARLLAEKLDIHSAFIIDVKAYAEDDTFGELKISQFKLPKDIHNVLVVDDCLFTGTTLDAVMKVLAENEQIDTITNAFLYKNAKTKYKGSKYIYAEAYDGNKLWLVFPWEKFNNN